jgi:hypothetical protein
MFLGATHSHEQEESKHTPLGYTTSAEQSSIKEILSFSVLVEHMMFPLGKDKLK